MSVLKIPDLSLVVLVGVTGSGKSTFAGRHFRPTEVISSDFCRGLVSDDASDQSATGDAFDVLHFIAGKRLAAGRLTVIDATSVQPAARQPLIDLARRHHVLAVAIVLDVPEATCAARNSARPDRGFGPHVLRQQQAQLRRSLGGLRREGFHRVVVLRGEAEIDAAVIEREPLWNDRRTDHGPFDIIGDVHGCFAELIALLGRLGYAVDPDGASARHPAGRTAVFVGDQHVVRLQRRIDRLRRVLEREIARAARLVDGQIRRHTGKPRAEPRASRRSLGQTTDRLPTARIRPDRVVECRTAGPQARLVAREAWLRCASQRGVDPVRDIPASIGRHCRRRRRPRLARTLLRQRCRQRLGGDPADAGMDSGQDRPASSAVTR